MSEGFWSCPECSSTHQHSETHEVGCTNTVCRVCHLRARHASTCDLGNALDRANHAEFALESYKSSSHLLVSMYGDARTALREANESLRKANEAVKEANAKIERVRAIASSPWTRHDASDGRDIVRRWLNEALNDVRAKIK